MTSHRHRQVDVTLSILASVVVFSTIWCHVEGRSNRVPNVIFTSRNTSVEPCNNFYDFVCGGWIKDNPIPENKTRWNMYRAADKVINGRLKDILEKEDVSDDNEEIKDARKFYRACLDVDRQAKRNMEILLERLAVWGGWPMATKHWKQEKFDWKKLMIHLIRTYHVSPLLRISVETDTYITSQRNLAVQKTYEACSQFISISKLKAWKDFFLNSARFIAKANNQTVSRKRLLAEANDVMRFYLNLCQNEDNFEYYNLIFAELRNLTEEVEPEEDSQNLTGSADHGNDFERNVVITIAELQNLTEEVETLKEDSQINWLDLLNDFLEGAEIDLDEDVEVALENFDFIESLIRSIDKISPKTLANYMLWNLVLNMKDISPGLRQLGYEFTERVIGATEAMPRWQTCVEETNTYFPLALGYEYVSLYLDGDAKKNVEEIVSNILNSFIEDLNKIDWMDEETRAAAIEKAENLVVNVGYPEWYDDATNIGDYLYSQYVIGTSHILNMENIMVSLTLQEAKSLVEERNRESWFTQVAVPWAYYYVESNAISIPAGTFQPPFYVKGRPEALNYGAIGSIIAHEITHAFDVEGRMADKFGNLYQWWSTDSLKTYFHKKDCFVEQYNQYPVTELLRGTEAHVPDQLDGTGTVSENIADNGGVQVAYAAYLKSIHQHGTVPRLPGLVHYSHQQLFFIGHTLVWCESGNQQSLSQDIMHIYHSPSKYRVLIPLGNSKDFADAWKCRQNDVMNPTQKCQFW